MFGARSFAPIFNFTWKAMDGCEKVRVGFRNLDLDERSWLLRTSYGDLPLCRFFNRIVRLAFYWNNSPFGAPEHLNLSKYTASHVKPVGWYYASHDATQRNAKQNQNVNQTPPAAGSRPMSRLHTRRWQKRDLSSCDAWIQSSLHLLIPMKKSAGMGGWWGPNGCSSHMKTLTLHKGLKFFITTQFPVFLCIIA